MLIFRTSALQMRTDGEADVSVYIQNLGIYTLNATGEANPVASIMVTVLAEMANIERSNIVYRLNSGRESYIASGGKLGRKKGSVKSTEQKKEEYKRGYIILKARLFCTKHSKVIQC